MRRSKLAACIVVIASAAAFAQPFGRPRALQNVGIDQKLGAQLPMNLTFTDETGKAVRLGDYFHGKPVILTPVYYQCPMLCNLVLNGLTRALRNIPLTPGKDFEVVSFSFDPRERPEMAADKKRSYLEKYGRDGAEAGWHFLTGKVDQIHALTDAIGFHYNWDNNLQQWAHASGIMVATPEGRLSHYFYGINYQKQDIRLSLVESSHMKIGTPVDQILLFCYHYDPTKGTYGLAIVNALRIAGSATVVALGMFLFVSLRRERKGAPKH
jgi:protein SCO1/2